MCKIIPAHRNVNLIIRNFTKCLVYVQHFMIYFMIVVGKFNFQ